jgi:hypothetical protein
MKYAVEMGSVPMMCIPSFIKTGSGIQNYTGRGFTDTHEHGGRIILILFFKIRKVG